MASLQNCLCRTVRSRSAGVAAAAGRSVVGPAIAGPSSMSAMGRAGGAARGLSTTLMSGGRSSSARTASGLLAATSLREQGRSRALPTGWKQQARTMFVTTETTPNADAIKFLPGGQVLSETGQTHEFMNATDARISPLASALFDISGVKLVFFGPDFISVNKSEDAQWSLLKPEVYAVIIEHFTQGKPLYYEGAKDGGGPEDTRILDTDSEVLAMIKELLDTRVRPALQEDGGGMTFEGFDEGTGIVKISLQGSCRGCDSSTVTLKNGVERMLMHYIPEVKGVEQVLSESEAVATDEFAKFEARLRGEGKTVTI